MIEVIGYSGSNEYEIRYDGKVAGVFRLYEDPDFSYIVKEFDIKSLIVDDIDDIPMKTLIDIYRRLGFRLIEGSERFMIKE